MAEELYDDGGSDLDFPQSESAPRDGSLDDNAFNTEIYDDPTEVVHRFLSSASFAYHTSYTVREEEADKAEEGPKHGGSISDDLDDDEGFDLSMPADRDMGYATDSIPQLRDRAQRVTTLSALRKEEPREEARKSPQATRAEQLQQQVLKESTSSVLRKTKCAPSPNPPVCKGVNIEKLANLMKDWGTTSVPSLTEQSETLSAYSPTSPSYSPTSPSYSPMQLQNKRKKKRIPMSGKAEGFSSAEHSLPLTPDTHALRTAAASPSLGTASVSDALVGSAQVQSQSAAALTSMAGFDFGSAPIDPLSAAAERPPGAGFGRGAASFGSAQVQSQSAAAPTTAAGFGLESAAMGGALFGSAQIAHSAAAPPPGPGAGFGFGSAPMGGALFGSAQVVHSAAALPPGPAAGIRSAPMGDALSGSAQQAQSHLHMSLSAPPPPPPGPTAGIRSAPMGGALSGSAQQAQPHLHMSLSAAAPPSGAGFGFGSAAMGGALFGSAQQAQSLSSAAAPPPGAGFGSAPMGGALFGSAQRSYQIKYRGISNLILPPPSQGVVQQSMPPPTGEQGHPPPPPSRQRTAYQHEGRHQHSCNRSSIVKLRRCSFMPVSAGDRPGIYVKATADGTPVLKIPFAEDFKWRQNLHLINANYCQPDHKVDVLLESIKSLDLDGSLFRRISIGVQGLKLENLISVLIEAGVLSLGKSAATDILFLFMMRIAKYMTWIVKTCKNPDEQCTLVDLYEKISQLQRDHDFYTNKMLPSIKRIMKSYPGNRILQRLELGKDWPEVLVNMMSDQTNKLVINLYAISQ